MKNRVLLIGGFRKAMALAESLTQRGYAVTVINKSYSDCKRLAENDALQVIQGDGSRTYVLEDALAYENDIAIALTKRDEDNLVICQLCKKVLGVKKTVALVNDPKKTDFFYNMGIDSVVCASNMITSILEQEALLEDMATILQLGEGRICISEVRIAEKDPSVGKRIWELDLPQEVIIGCILRGDHHRVPKGDTQILAGDVIVLISSKESQIEAIRVMTRGERT